MALSLLPAAALAAGFPGSGKGTATDPYVVTTAAELNAVRENLSACYKLGNDIDLTGTAYADAWKPIGELTYSADVNMKTGAMNLAKAFSGTFDGNGKTVSNVKAAADGDMLAAGGLFACVTGTVKDLTVRNVTVSGGKTNMTAGGVVGYAMSGSKLSNITLTGTNAVTGINCVGGITGGSESAAISGCTVTGTAIAVTGDNNFNAADSKTKGRIIQTDTAECGGLIVGGGFGGSVKNCTAAGTVTAAGNEPVGLGGIGGCLQCMSEISGNTATVTITTEKGGHAIGGLCGFAGTGDDGSGNQSGSYKESDRKVAAPSKIDNCAVNVTINAPGATHVGGLVGTGLYYYGMEDRFQITDCTVTGSITAGTDADSLYGASTPGAVAGRAVGSSVDGCTFAGLRINGAAAANKVGGTNVMYESADQYASKDGRDGGALLHSLISTYQPLFEGATFEQEYDRYWHDYCAAVVGEADADKTAGAMKSSVGGTLYGEEAVSNYAANPQSARFFCGFTGDLTSLTFNGSQISGYKKDGAELFSHAYRYVGYKTSTDQNRFSFYVYESLDSSAGEYRYFLMCPDTPDTTHHIEFRYGSDLAALLKLYTGDYAYWLAAGLPTSAMRDPQKSEVVQTIALFCMENEDYTAARTPASLTQIKDLVGTWIYYADGKAQPGTLYFSVDAKGSGRSYSQGKETSRYQVFAYDNDGSDALKSGIYAVNDGEPKWAKYSITTNSEGKTILTLTGKEDGKAYEISYIAADLPFADVAADAWYYDSAAYAYHNGLFSGTSATTFSPNASMTRQTVWMVLARMDGKTPATMADARAWAMKAGVSDGTDPAGAVTRQQLAATLYRYAQYKKYDIAQGGGNIRKFADYKEISQYALPGLSWAVNVGLVQGSDNRMMPSGGATRAQVAAILQRLSKVQTK